MPARVIFLKHCSDHLTYLSKTPQNETAVDEEVKQTESWMEKIAKIGKAAKEIDLSGGVKNFADIVNLEKIVENLEKINIDKLGSTSKLSEYRLLDFSSTLDINEIIRKHDAAESGLKALKEKFEQIKDIVRSEERRVGKECLRLCRSRWSPYH